MGKYAEVTQWGRCGKKALAIAEKIANEHPGPSCTDYISWYLNQLEQRCREEGVRWEDFEGIGFNIFPCKWLGGEE